MRPFHLSQKWSLEPVRRQYNIVLTCPGIRAHQQYVGYNIYRGSTSGGPYTKINSSLDAAASYTDGTVQSGQNYFYVTTALDSSGVESGYSNEVPLAVPTP